MTFVEIANRLEAEQGTIVDHFHARKWFDDRDEETIIFRSTSSEGYTRYITIDGWEPEPREFDNFHWHTFHGFMHEPLWQRSMKELKYPDFLRDEPEPWWIRLWKRIVSW